jgi:hypothetical protein
VGLGRADLTNWLTPRPSRIEPGMYRRPPPFGISVTCVGPNERTDELKTARFNAFSLAREKTVTLR